MEIEVKYVDQTPFLLSGSVRDNLDPTRRYGDGQLWRALSRCHLAAAVTGWGGLGAGGLERGGRPEAAAVPGARSAPQRSGAR